jgi:hypothetical protein
MEDSIKRMITVVSSKVDFAKSITIAGADWPPGMGCEQRKLAHFILPTDDT